MNYFLVLVLPCLVYASSVSPSCQSALAAMSNDVSFQYRNESLINQCYMQYQNSVALNQLATEPVACRQWEYEEFCTTIMSGQACVVSTGFVDISFCAPSECSSADFAGILGIYFNASTSSINCDIKEPTSLLAPALISTISVLLVSAFLVFAIRVPKEVREAEKLAKAKNNAPLSYNIS